MISKQGSKRKFRRNPHTVNLPDIPVGLDDDLTHYLSRLQTISPNAYKMQNANGNDIPVRMNNGNIEYYENKEWKPINGNSPQETEQNNTETKVIEKVIETVVVDSSSNTKEEPVSNTYCPLTKIRIDGESYTIVDPAYLYTIGDNLTLTEPNILSATDTKDYNDLENKPTIPTKTSDLTNDSDFANKSYVDGKVLSVLPQWTQADNGKVLGIVNGELAWVSIGE